MAKVYGGVEGLEAPQFSINGDYDVAFDQYREQLKQFCTSNSKCPDAGKTIRFPIADGYAEYMVLDYKQLIHVPYGDAYKIPDAYARGLTKADIVQNIKREEAFAEIFGIGKELVS